MEPLFTKPWPIPVGWAQRALSALHIVSSLAHDTGRILQQIASFSEVLIGGLAKLATAKLPNS
jgi:hypothetical protein